MKLVYPEPHLFNSIFSNRANPEDAVFWWDRKKAYFLRNLDAMCFTTEYIAANTMAKVRQQPHTVHRIMSPFKSEAAKSTVSAPNSNNTSKTQFMSTSSWVDNSDRQGLKYATDTATASKRIPITTKLTNCIIGASTNNRFLIKKAMVKLSYPGLNRRIKKEQARTNAASAAWARPGKTTNKTHMQRTRKDRGRRHTRPLIQHKLKWVSEKLQRTSWAVCMVSKPLGCRLQRKGSTNDEQQEMKKSCMRKPNVCTKTPDLWARRSLTMTRCANTGPMVKSSGTTNVRIKNSMSELMRATQPTIFTDSRKVWRDKIPKNRRKLRNGSLQVIPCICSITLKSWAHVINWLTQNAAANSLPEQAAFIQSIVRRICRAPVSSRPSAAKRDIAR